MKAEFQAAADWGENGEAGEDNLFMKKEKSS